MQREILFRGKREDKGEWAYGDYGRGIDGNTYIKTLWPVDETPDDNYEDNWTIHAVIPETVGEYTGLEAIDSNRYITVNGERVKDLRIFEGDILMFPKFPGNGEFVAVFYSGCFYAVELEYYGKKDIEELPMFSAYWWANNGNGIPEIIGNVHDTPELLDRDKDVPL